MTERQRNPLGEFVCEFCESKFSLHSDREKHRARCPAAKARQYESSWTAVQKTLLKLLVDPVAPHDEAFRYGIGLHIEHSASV
jgi:hypothetical protein